MVFLYLSDKKFCLFNKQCYLKIKSMFESFLLITQCALTNNVFWLAPSKWFFDQNYIQITLLKKAYAAVSSNWRAVQIVNKRNVFCFVLLDFERTNGRHVRNQWSLPALTVALAEWIKKGKAYLGWLLEKKWKKKIGKGNDH